MDKRRGPAAVMGNPQRLFRSVQQGTVHVQEDENLLIFRGNIGGLISVFPRNTTVAVARMTGDTAASDGRRVGCKWLRRICNRARHPVLLRMGQEVGRRADEVGGGRAPGAARIIAEIGDAVVVLFPWAGGGSA